MGQTIIYTGDNEAATRADRILAQAAASAAAGYLADVAAAGAAQIAAIEAAGDAIVTTALLPRFNSLVVDPLGPDVVIAYTGADNGMAFNSSGVITTLAGPRLDYGVSGADMGVLVEPAATNYCLQSRTINTSPWTTVNTSATATWTTSAVTGPFGSAATRATLPAITAANRVAQKQQLITGLTTGETYTASIWAKGISGGEELPLILQHGASPFTLLAKATFICSTGWQRFSVKFVTLGTSIYIGVGPSSSGPVGQNTWAAATLDIDNITVELGDTATSDLITTTGTVTRDADELTLAIPLGIETLQLRFADASDQEITVTPGSYSLDAADLNGRKLRSLRLEGPARRAAQEAAQIKRVTLGAALLGSGGVDLSKAVTASGGSGGLSHGPDGTLIYDRAPRVDYGPSGRDAGVLVEPAATNYCLQSNSISDGPWVKALTGSGQAVTFAGGRVTGPDGTASAQRVTFTASVANSNASQQQIVGGLTAAAQHQASVWVRGTVGGERISLVIQHSASPFTVLGMVVIDATTSWQRFSCPFIPTGTSIYVSIGTNSTIAKGALAGGTVDLFNCQIEAGDFPTSDIISVTAAEIRTADVVTVPVRSTATALAVTFTDGHVEEVAATSPTTTLPTTMTRRKVASVAEAVPATSPIAGVTLGPAISQNLKNAFNWCRADVWDNVWTDDDRIIAVNDDSFGWNASTPTSNIEISLLSDFDGSVTGSSVNKMAEFGTLAQTGSDSHVWKGNGIVCIDRVLYLWVSRHKYGTAGTGWIQTTQGAQLIKSTDYGVTWTPLPPTTAQPYASPMFATRFTSPFFVKFGKDNAGGPTAHRADEFVYAVSAEKSDGTGVWNNGDRMILARCALADLPDLSAGDWQFYQGGDGTDDANWGAVGTTSPIMSLTKKCSMQGIQYLPFANRYVMIQWYYPSVVSGTADGTSPGMTNTTSWDVWESETPWGPWTNVETLDPGDGLYNPSLVPKSLSIDDGENMWLAAAGDFKNTTEITGKYALWMVPVRFDV